MSLLPYGVRISKIEAQRGGSRPARPCHGRPRCAIRNRVADLNRIRARLSGARSEAEKLLEQRPPPLQQDAGAEGRSRKLELELEHERGRREELAARRRQARAEKRIAELEGELQAERELREDLELALELLEKHQADDARKVQDAERAALERLIVPNGKDAPDQAQPQVAGEQLPGAKPASANPEPKPGRSREDPADGWGVPLEAFPITEPGEEPGGVGKGSAGAGEAARQARSRRRSRRGGR